MEHVVFFPAPDGTPAFRRFAGLDDAVRFVEHLRNVENVSEASVYSLTEVPLSFKTWYRVEVPTTQPARAEAQAAEISGPSPAVEIPLPAPTTVAEAMASYGNAADEPFAQPAVAAAGSATGIVVPDQPLVAVDQFGLPAAGVPGAAEPAVAPAESEPRAQVLEPAFGGRRDRGMGFFAR